MKVALCISGQPRSAVETYPYIYENIIKPNNADVFIHMNYDDTNSYIEKSHTDSGNCVFPKDIDKTVIDMYKPVRHLVESPRNFRKPRFNIPEKRTENIKKMNHHKHWTDEETRQHDIKQITSMYYSIFKCNELKETYANENGFQYDYVIRLRFDLIVYHPIICSQIDPNYIYYLEMGQPDELISDWLNIGSNAIMNIYSSMYFSMDYINQFRFFKKHERQVNTLDPSEICGGISEYMVRDLMYLHKIPIMGIRIQFKLIK
jgi:hypothetical protein